MAVIGLVKYIVKLSPWYRTTRFYLVSIGFMLFFIVSFFYYGARCVQHECEKYKREVR